jgi:hypothetical protein
MDKTKHKSEELLMETIGFSEEDLEINRAGYFTKRQTQIMRLRRNLWLCLGVVAGFATYVVSVNIRWGWELYLAIFCYSGLKFVQLNAVVQARTLGKAEGIISLQQRPGIGKDLVHNLIKIDDITIRVSEKVFSAFKDAQSYRIYYSIYGMRIFSAEWLREG